MRVACFLPRPKPDAAVAEHSRLLVDAERSKWAVGESDLFRVNTREVAWVKARKAPIDGQFEAQMTVREFEWWRGTN